jgi:hypothetical protein
MNAFSISVLVCLQEVVPETVDESPFVTSLNYALANFSGDIFWWERPRERLDADPNNITTIIQEFVTKSPEIEYANFVGDMIYQVRSIAQHIRIISTPLQRLILYIFARLMFYTHNEK